MVNLLSGKWEILSGNGTVPDYLPVDHRANFSGYRTENGRRAAETAPWPVRRRIGVFVLLALAAWIVLLAPILLIY